MPEVHPTAVVDPRAELGEGVRVGPWSVIGPEVVVGERTWIGSHVVLDGPLSIGSDCTIRPHASLGTPPQDKGYHGEPTRLEVGRGCWFGEYANASRASTKEEGRTVIGDDCYLMAYVHVGHDCRLGRGVVIANATQLAGHCLVGDWANLSGVVGVGQFIRIGAYSITSGGSALNRDVPPYGMVAGVTAVLVGVNLVGLKRGGFTAEEIAGVKRAYRILFMSDLPLAEAGARVREELGGSERVRFLLEFVESSKKGVCRMERSRSR